MGQSWFVLPSLLPSFRYHPSNISQAYHKLESGRVGEWESGRVGEWERVGSNAYPPPTSTLPFSTLPLSCPVKRVIAASIINLKSSRKFSFLAHSIYKT